MRISGKTVWIAASALCLSLFALQYGTTNIDKLMAARGDYYFAKNDIPNAVKFYESAFELGDTDLKRRTNYVNMIINSPFDVKAQERLYKFTGYSVDDGAKLRAEFFLYDMRREIFRKYQNNYIKKAVYNGKIMRWDKLPITYAFKSDKEIPEYYIKETEKAFLAWEKALEHAVYFERTTSNPNILIEFKEKNNVNNEEKKYVAAYTTPKINSEQKLVGMDMVFYVKDIENKYFSETDVYNTSLHEIGHALGLMGHSEGKNDVMYMSRESVNKDEGKKIELTQADINTMKLLYSTKPDITNIYDTKSLYIPYVVLGDDKEVTNSKIREAKFYIRKAPNLPMGYIDLAMGYVSAQDYARAIKSLEKALQVANSNEVLSIIYYNLAVSYFYIDNMDLAKDNVLNAIKIKDTEDCRHLLAEIYLREGKVDKAIYEYGSLVKQHPQNTAYTITLANIYIKRHEYMNARKVLKNYFRNNPNDRKNPRFAPYGIVMLGL